MISVLNRKSNIPKHFNRYLQNLFTLSTLLPTLIILSGCATAPDRFYIPKGIPVASGTILNPTFKVDRFVNLENGQPNTDWIQIGTESHEWLANLNRWTDTAVHLAEAELKKRGSVVMVNAATVFELDLCKDSEGRVSGFLRTDVKKVGCPLDTDGDGVSDFLDQCPCTPLDAEVDHVGCPLDTDDDGAPNYRDACPGKAGEEKASKNAKPPGKIQTGATTTHDQKGSFSVPCHGEGSRFTVAGPVPPDAVIRLIQQHLGQNGILLSETEPNVLTFSATAGQWNSTLDLLKMELGKRDIMLVDGPPRILRLSITFAKLFWTFYDVGCNLNLEVQTGDDRVQHYKVSTLSPELYNSCDEAVSKAVSGMFMPKRPVKDTDKDDVPDYRDKCPETPEGVAVDTRGCPLDTDKDGVPNYRDQCSSTPESVPVGDEGCPLDTDGDSVPDYRDKCPETPEGIAVDTRGCPLDTDKDGVSDYRDQCPNTPEGIAVDEKGCRKNPKNRYVLIPDLDGDIGRLTVASEKGSQVLDKAFEATGLNNADEVPSTPIIMDEAEVKRIFKDALNAQPTPPVHFILYFTTGTTVLTPQSMAQLPKVLKSIEDRRSVDLTISGHTDRTGSKNFNRGLSLERAGKVAEFLVKKGVDPKIIEITSHGEGNPLVKTADGVAEPKNRRVEVVVR